MAPECLKGQICLRNDVWSIGIVLIELLTAAPAWGRVTDLFHLYSLFHNQAMPSGLVLLVPEQYHNIIRLCLVYGPEKRPKIVFNYGRTALTIFLI